MTASLTIAMDLGGVCLAVHPERAAALAGDALPKLTPVAAAYERGLLDTAAFAERVREFAAGAGNDAAILAAWNSIIGDPLPGMAELVAELTKNGHRIVAFSDTSPAHLAECRKKFPIAAGVYSFEAGMGKPEGPAMFERFERLYGVPDLYVDDREVCLAGGRTRRWPVHLFTGAEPLRAAVEELLRAKNSRD